MKLETDVIIRQLKILEKEKREQGKDEFADGVQQSINEIVMILHDKGYKEISEIPKERGKNK